MCFVLDFLGKINTFKSAPSLQVFSADVSEGSEQRRDVLNTACNNKTRENRNTGLKRKVDVLFV